MLDSTKLSQAIEEKIQSEQFALTEENKAFILAISEAIIDHFINNAVIETKGSATAQVGIIK